MTITRRTLAIISVSMLVVMLSIYIIISRFFISSILSFEEREMKVGLIRAADAIAFDVMTLEKFTSDWSVWNETYDFVKSGNIDEYPSLNLTDDTVENQAVNMLLFVNETGELVYSHGYDLERHHTVEIPAATAALLYTDPLLLSPEEPYQSVVGLVEMPAGPMMIVSEPVYDSEMSQPRAGWMIVGRYLNDMEMSRLAQVIHLPAVLIPSPYDNSTGRLDLMAADLDLDHDLNIQMESAADTSTGRAFINDIHGQPRFLLEVQMPRFIYSQGMRTAGLIAVLLGLNALVVLLVVFVLFKRQVLDRIICMTRKIGKISSLDEIPDFDDGGDDEISWLALQIQKMLNDLKESHDEYHYISNHDALTDVHNRSYYERFVQKMDGEPDRQWGVIVCDIDGLKLANDLVGHHFGDELLARLSATLKETCPPDAMIARIGGDEFLIILEENNEESLGRLCRNIQAELNRDSQTDGLSLVSLSVSLGYASNEHCTKSLKQLVRTADHLMHREKLHRSQSGSSGLVSTLRGALGARDYLTEGHAGRMRDLSFKLAGAIGLEPQRIPDLLLFTEFHDVGKIGVPDGILFKPGPLDAEEWAKMQRHCQIGYQIAQTTPDLMPIADFILKHHEWWNGGGYPQGLAGMDIPVECRILAVVDAWDAMTNDRPYRQAMPDEEAIAELRRGAGTQFDPLVVAKFVSIVAEESACA